MTYRIKYIPSALRQLHKLPVYDQRIITDGVDEQLPHQPTVETKNRKFMRPNPVAPWELRLGNLRVYYDVEEQPLPLVVVLAIGVKKGNKVYIEGEVANL